MYNYSKEQLKGLAAEADASLSQAKAAYASKEVGEEADSLLSSTNYALKVNESYRIALFSVLENIVQRNLRDKNKVSSQVTACAEGILLVCATAIWLYAKKDDPSGALKAASQDAKKLVLLLAPSSSRKELPTIHSPVQIRTLLNESLSPYSEALREFLHSWDIVRWIHEKDAELEFHSSDRAEIFSAISDSPYQVKQRQHELELKRDIFQSIVLHYEATKKNQHDGEEERWQKRRARDKCIEKHTLSDSTVPDNTNLKRLQCLYCLLDTFNPGLETMVLSEELSSCLKELSSNSTNESATMNLVGGVLACASLNHEALESFHKSLQANPDRIGRP